MSAVTALSGSPEDCPEMLQMAQNLVDCLQNNRVEEANRVIQDICKLREASLFQEIGKLTRELHETLNRFAHDEALEKLMQESLPDAKKRLDYVVKMTEDSAHKTISIIEQCMEVANGQEERTRRFRESVGDAAVGGIEAHLDGVIDSSKQMHSALIEVLMAQSYQDLTGQVLQRIITLVQDVETSLVAMIRTCGLNNDDAPKQENGRRVEKDNRGYGPDVPGVTTNSKETVSSQDEVDDLLSNLGF